MPIFPAGAEHLTEDATGSQIAGVLNRVQDFLIANPPVPPMVLTHQRATLAAPVALPPTTMVDVLSISLAAGTWLVIGHMGVSNTATGNWCAMKLWDGATILAADGAMFNLWASTHVSAVVVTATLTTITISATGTGGEIATVMTNAFSSGVFSNVPATYIDAVKIG